jgi:hypothetical protein
VRYRVDDLEGLSIVRLFNWVAEQVGIGQCYVPRVSKLVAECYRCEERRTLGLVAQVVIERDRRRVSELLRWEEQMDRISYGELLSPELVGYGDRSGWFGRQRTQRVEH